MVATRNPRKPSPRAEQDRQYRLSVIEHYSQFIEMRLHPETGNPRRFNPVLDEEKNPERNRLGLRHGQKKASDLAKCQCEKCVEGKRKAKAGDDANRMEKAKEAEAARIAAAVVRLRPDVSAELARLAAETVLVTARTVRPKGDHRAHTILFSYKPEQVTLAVKLWAMENGLMDPAGEGMVAELVAAVAERPAE